MLEYARIAHEIVAEISYHSYERNRRLQLSVERALEIMGEAARRVSDGFRASHPEIPWGKIISQRNFLAHEYDEVLQQRVWQTVSENIPELIKQLEEFLPNLP